MEPADAARQDRRRPRKAERSAARRSPPNEVATVATLYHYTVVALDPDGDELGCEVGQGLARIHSNGNLTWIPQGSCPVPGHSQRHAQWRDLDVEGRVVLVSSALASTPHNEGGDILAETNAGGKPPHSYDADGNECNCTDHLGHTTRRTLRRTRQRPERDRTLTSTAV